MSSLVSMFSMVTMFSRVRICSKFRMWGKFRIWGRGPKSPNQTHFGDITQEFVDMNIGSSPSICDGSRGPKMDQIGSIFRFVFFLRPGLRLFENDIWTLEMGSMGVLGFNIGKKLPKLYKHFLYKIKNQHYPMFYIKH